MKLGLKSKKIIKKMIKMTKNYYCKGAESSRSQLKEQHENLDKKQSLSELALSCQKWIHLNGLKE